MTFQRFTRVANNRHSRQVISKLASILLTTLLFIDKTELEAAQNFLEQAARANVVSKTCVKRITKLSVLHCDNVPTFITFSVIYSWSLSKPCQMYLLMVLTAQWPAWPRAYS